MQFHIDQEKKKKFLQKLKIKYRLVIMKDDTFEEKLSFKLTRLNVFLVIGSISILLVIITTYIIAFTPLREYIPGYSSDVSMREKVIMLNLKSDSIDENISQKELYINNIKNIVEGHVADKEQEEKPVLQANVANVKITKSKEDSLLRQEFEQADRFNLTLGTENQNSNSIASFSFYAPCKGIIVAGFNPSANHYGIDLAVGNKDEAVKATLDGKVIFSDWTIDAGYVVVIQHTGNLSSVYKHNSVILKKTGTYVRAGEAIAIVGNSGRLSSNIHLHFEIWFNGNPVNPKDYMSF